MARPRQRIDPGPAGRACSPPGRAGAQSTLTGSGRPALALATAALVGALLVGCGGAAPSPASQPAKPAATVAAAGPKPTSAPTTPQPSPTPDPAGRAAPDAGICPESHQIKGQTVASGEKIYYEPNRPEYPTITPEVCFTAGGDARANGYRSSRQ